MCSHTSSDQQVPNLKKSSHLLKSKSPHLYQTKVYSNNSHCQHTFEAYEKQLFVVKLEVPLQEAKKCTAGTVYWKTFVNLAIR